MNSITTATLRIDRSLAFRVAGSKPAQPRKLLLLAHGVGGNETNLAALADGADAWLSRLGIPHQTRLYPGDHGIPPAMQDDFFAWFASM